MHSFLLHRCRWALGSQVSMLIAGMLFSGCLGDSGTVVVKGGVPGLDSLALRGDSLIARISERRPLSLDSLRVAMEAELERRVSTLDTGSDIGTRLRSRAATDVADAPGLPGRGAEMSREAQARGDSMARATAGRLVGRVGEDRSRVDTVRGVLTFRGVEPTRQVVLQTPDGTVALSGMATRGLARVVGTEVVIRGVRISPVDIVVSDYIVRASEGVRVYDGVLNSVEGTLRLTGGGVHRVPVPPAIRSLSGSRVWIAVRDGVPIRYGVIGNR